jgi:hypothetical protein
MTTQQIAAALTRWTWYAALALILPACLEVETSTEVRQDGSLTRTVAISGDSAQIPASLRMMGIDSSWLFERRPPEGNKHTLTASRTFGSVESMARALAGERGTRLQITPRLEKSFHWFFTRYRYSETWAKTTVIDVVPMSNFLSTREIGMIADGALLEKQPTASRGDSLAFEELGERFMEWDANNRFEAYYREFLSGVRALNDPSLPVETVEAKKERLFEATFKKAGFREGDLAGYRGEFARILKTSAVSRAFDANRSGIDSVERLMDFEGKVDDPSYTVNITLPGIITETNAPALEGNRGSWKDFMTTCLFADYTMRIESSVVNWWAIVISALVLVFIIVLTMLGMIRARKLRTPAPA